MLYAIAAMENKLDQLLANGGWASSGAAAALPPGYIAAFVDGAIPSGWQKLDGSALAIADNPVLYALFGDRYAAMLDELTTRAQAASIVPPMTSNTAPAGYTASASSQYSATFAPFCAFDGVLPITDASNCWMAASSTCAGWLAIALPAAKGLCKYKITSRGNTGADPSAFTREGSNDGIQWTVLDTRTGITNWTIGSSNTFELDASKLAATYNRFRLNVTACASADSYLAIGELTLYGGTPVIGSPPPAGQFRVPNLASSATAMPGGAWCVKLG